MAKPTISAIFNAVDRITGPVNKMDKRVSLFGKSVNKSFGGAMSDSIGKFRGLIASTAAILTTGAIAKSINAFASKGDEIAKTSRQIGMSAEALQELRYAADLSGVSNEDLTKSFKLLNKNVGDLIAGQGTLKSFLEKTNPKLARQLKTVKNTEEAFGLLVDEIQKQPNQMRKAAIAQAAFGRSGQDLLRFIEIGKDGMAELRKEAQRLGLVMSTDAANKSEVFLDSITRLKGSLDGLKNNVIPQLITQITPLIDKFTEWTVVNQDLITNNLQKFLDTTGQMITKLWEMRDVLKAVAIGFVGLKVATELIGIFKALTFFTGAFNGVIFATQAFLGGAATAMEALNFAAASNPFGLLAIVLTGVIALLVKLGKKLGVMQDVASGKSEQAAIEGLYGSSPYLQSANQNVITSNTEKMARQEWSGVLSINGLPPGSTFKSKGEGIMTNLDYGYQPRGH